MKTTKKPSEEATKKRAEARQYRLERQHPSRMQGKMDGNGDPYLIAFQQDGRYEVRIVNAGGANLALEQVRRIAGLLGIRLEEEQR